jgi:hypothetical protein
MDLEAIKYAFQYFDLHHQQDGQGARAGAPRAKAASGISWLAPRELLQALK